MTRLRFIANCPVAVTRWLLCRHGFTGLFVVLVGALWLFQAVGAGLVVTLVPEVIDHFGEEILVGVSFAQVPAGAWMVWRACSRERSIEFALVTTVVLLAVRVFADLATWIAVIVPRALAADGAADTAATFAGLTGAALLHTPVLHTVLMLAALLVARWPDPPSVDPDGLQDVGV